MPKAEKPSSAENSDVGFDSVVFDKTMPLLRRCTRIKLGHKCVFDTFSLAAMREHQQAHDEFQARVSVPGSK